MVHSGLTPLVPMAATSPDIISERLSNQRLIKPGRTKPEQIVAWMGAMQAQDYAGAKWGIGLRAPGCQDADVDEAFNSGKILRTHVLRPTWHFVAPADIRWILALSGPRVHAVNAYVYRQTGLSAKVLSRACAMLHRVLDDGEPMTRAELAVPLRRAKVAAEGLKLAYVVMHAELEGLICSGPRRGKQFTYMLLDQRAPSAKPIDRRDALAALAKRYFCSHGPATIRDFTWWSGLTVKDTELGIEAIKPKLQKEVIDGRIYWSTSSTAGKVKAPGAFLLPNYDEYLIAYKDRSPVVDAGKTANIVARSGGAMPHHLIVDGRLAGSWTREVKGNSVEIQVAPYAKLTPAQSRAVASAAECYGEFLGMPAALTVA